MAALQWEYAIVYSDSDQCHARISFSARHAVSDLEIPHGAFSPTIGELDGKGWQLVAVTALVDDTGILRERHYFKRRQRPARGLLD